MEPVYAIKSTYDEENGISDQVVASKPRMMPKEDDGKKIRFLGLRFWLKGYADGTSRGSGGLYGIWAA